MKDNNKLIQLKNIILLNKELFILYQNDLINLNLNVDNLKKILDELNILNNCNIPLFIYLQKEKIKKILYDNEENIKISNYNISNNLCQLFYLDLLILDNKDIVDYVFTFNFIKQLNDYNMKINKVLQKTILSKIIIDLINCFEEPDNFNVNDQKELSSIKDQNNKIIENIDKNVPILKNLDLIINDKKVKIDMVYSKIINELIISKKIYNYDYAYDIIEQLDLENIDINNVIFNELSKTLKNEDIINEYKITNKEELFNEKKINFYYILLRYILKNSLYIYSIAFLSETKHLIIKIIKSNELIYNNNNIDNVLKDRLDYIIKFLVDSNYYYFKLKKIIPESDLIKLNVILQYYKNFYFYSKKNDINKIEDIIKNNSMDYQKYLDEYITAQKMNDRYPIINYLFKNDNEYNEINKNNFKDLESKLTEVVTRWSKYEILINDRKIKKMRKNEKNILMRYFKDIKNEETLLKIFQKDIYKFFINESQPDVQNCTNDNMNNNTPNQAIEYNKNIIDENPAPIQENWPNKKIKENLDKNNNIQNKIINKEPILNQELDIYNKSSKINSDFNDLSKLQMGNQNEEESILYQILNNSTFRTHLDSNNNLIIDKILYGNNNMKINYDTFERFLLNNKNNTKKNIILFNNLERFSTFLKDTKNELKNNYKNKNNLKMELNFKKEEKKEEEIEDNNKDIYNIRCTYIFEDYFTKIQCTDCDILINSIYSKSLGLHYFLYQIQNTIYRNPEIQNNQNNIPNNIKKNIPNNSIIKNNKEINEQSLNDETRENSRINQSINYVNNLDDSTRDHSLSTVSNLKKLADDSTRDQSFSIVSNLKKLADEDAIIEFIKIVEKENNYNGFIKEMSNGHYLTYKSDNSLTIYNTNFFQVMNIKQNKGTLFGACERVYHKEEDKNKMQIIVSAKNELVLITIDLHQNIHKIHSSYDVSHINCLNCFEIKESNYILLGSKCGIHYINLFDSQGNKKERKKKNKKNNDIEKFIIVEKAYFGGLKINDNIYIMTSNSIFPGGEDSLFFYNTKKKNTSNKIDGYSFILSPNGIAIMPREDKKQKNLIRIVLCACKKYKSEQKNGILLVNPQLGNNKRVNDEFYDTGNFEVHCFCPILIVENNNQNYDNINGEYRNKIKIIDTEYFFVGGFDEDKRKGMIKLYKVIYNEKAYDTKIEYIQDIELESNKKIGDINGAINCILQSTISGNIIVTCSNEKLYLFTPPNLKYYLDNRN